MKEFTFTKFASFQPATLLKILPNDFFKDIGHNNRTPCFNEELSVAVSKFDSRKNNVFRGLIGVAQIRMISFPKTSNDKTHG